MFIKQFLYIQRSDRRALLILLVLTALTIIVIYALNYTGLQSNQIEANNNSGKDNKQTTTDVSHGKAERDSHNAENATKEQFFFDPNTADSSQLKRLGLQPWQIRSIYKYRARGGVYQTKEDFAFVYGLTVRDYKRLAPYIRIAKEFMPASTLIDTSKRTRQKGRYHNFAINGDNDNKDDVYGKELRANYSFKIKKGEFIAINNSDTAAIKRIPGIGSYYARKIVRYRERLGGFVDKNQLLEIENFPREALAYIEVNKEKIRKLNVNKLTLYQLKLHPYINYYQARAITDYRRLHGEIKDIGELRLLKEFSDLDMRRIEPYIEY